MKKIFFLLIVFVFFLSFSNADQKAHSESLMLFSGSEEQASISSLLESNTGDWLVRSVKSKPKSLTPFLDITVEGNRIKSYLYESLLRRKHDLSGWEGLLAERWKVSDDGLSYTFHLRPNIIFSDGEKLDASDVLFTYNFLMNKAIAAPGERSYFKRLEKVTSSGPLEVTFKYKEPYYRSLGLVGNLPILPKHHYEKFLDNPEAFNTSRIEILGTGPYVFDDSNGKALTGNEITLKRNSRYWGDNKGTFDKLVWRVLDNDNARLVAYRNGEIDFYEANPARFESLKKEKDIIANSQSFEFMKTRQSYTYIAWNPVFEGKPTPFADRRVRLAMTHLTNRQAIVDQAYAGFAEIEDSPFRKSGLQRDPSLVGHEYDLEKGKKMLAELGYLDRDKDGVIEDKEGKPFRFTFTYASDREDSRLVALLIRDNYAKAGILVDLDPQVSAVLYDMMDKKSFQALTSGWGGGIETDIYIMFHSKEIQNSLYNFISYNNPQLDALIDQAHATVDETKRMAVWRQAERILHEEQPYTFLARRKSLYLVNSRLKNVKVEPAGFNLDLVPIKVYVPNALQKH